MKTATVIPIHPPRFGFANQIVETWNKFCTSDLFFILSNPDDETNFKKLIEGNYKTLTLPENLTHYKNPITVKKFYGVQTLLDQYDYIGVFDSEMKVVKPFDTDSIYPEIFNTKYLKCNQCFPDVNGASVVWGNAKKLDLVKNEKLIEETDNYKWYWWFNEICVYEKNTTKRFFEYINNSNKLDIIYNEYWFFDYIVYGIYLICFENFKCKKFFPNRKFGFGAIEHNQFNIDKVTETFQSYMDSNQYPDNYPHIKVQFHMDRYIDEKDRHKFRME